MIKSLMKTVTSGILFAITANAADCAKEEANPAPNQFKLYAVIDESMDEGKRANAVAHMSLGLGELLKDKIQATPYITADGHKFEHISQHPFIILKGNMPKIRTLYDELVKIGSIPHVEFLDTMHLGPTFVQQIEATKQRNISDIRILGVTLFGPFEQLKPLLKKFSLLK